MKSPAVEALEVTRVAQIVALIKENQLITALCLFILWQTGAFLAVSSEVAGVVC